jgi:sulfide:quinone oxidoreductase
MKKRIVILGAGFGGLELASRLAEAMGDRLDVALIDKADRFVFGFSKLDLLFGKKPREAVELPYQQIVRPGVRVLNETVTAVDPASRRVTTDKGVHEADVLVLALGADYDMAATPGLTEHGHEFYTVPGAAKAAEALAAFTKGAVVVGIAAAPYKCPPAPSETVLLLHDYLTERGIRGDCTICLATPLPIPIPPSPETSRALMTVFAERGIRFVPKNGVRALDAARHVVTLDDGTELPCDLYLGVPKHRAPAALAGSGLLENGWIPVDPKTLTTKFAGVYAVGDVTSVGTPKAGVFAEAAARVVAQEIIAGLSGGEQPAPFAGAGSCYVEFGGQLVGRVDVDFFSGPAPSGIFNPPTAELAAEKQQFGAERRRRWFGM